MRAFPPSLLGLLLAMGGCSPAPERSVDAPARLATDASPAAYAAGAATLDRKPGFRPEAGPWHWLVATRAGAFVRVADPGRYQIEFGADGQLLLLADCNRGRASFAIGEDGSFQPGPVGLSKMGCPADSQDREFVATLGGMRRIEVNGDWVRLSGAGVDMLFARRIDSVLHLYDCERGPPFAAAFGAGEVALLADGRWQVLMDVPAASGTRHTGNGWEFGSSGEQAYLTGPVSREGCRSRV